MLQQHGLPLLHIRPKDFDAGGGVGTEEGLDGTQEDFDHFWGIHDVDFGSRGRIVSF